MVKEVWTMTDQGDQEILQMADDIRSKQSKQTEEDFERERDNWFKSMIGRYFKEYTSGADEDAFLVYYVRKIDDFGNYLTTDEIQFSHIGHWFFHNGSLSYDKKNDFTKLQLDKSEYIKEITKEEYYEYIRILFNKIGILEDWYKGSG